MSKLGDELPVLNYRKKPRFSDGAPNSPTQLRATARSRAKLPKTDSALPNRIAELQRTREKTPSYGLRSGRDTGIDNEDYEWLARRNELGAAQINRMKADPWRGGYKIWAETEELERQIAALVKALDLEEQLSRAWVLKKVFGMSLLHIPLDTKLGTTNAMVKPGALKQYRKEIISRKDARTEEEYLDMTPFLVPAEALSRLQIEEYKLGEDKLPERWQVLSGAKEDATKYWIHRDRVVHLHNWKLNSDPWGTSEFHAQYDVLVDSANLNIAMVEAYMKSAVGLAHLQVPKGATAEDFTWAKAHFHNLDMLSELITPPPKGEEPWKVEIHRMDKGTPPTEFMEALWTRVSIVSRLNKTILKGTEAGKLTGSELNYKEFYALISEWQKDLGKHFEEVVRKFQVWGLLDEGQFGLDWEALDKPSAKEIAQTKQLEAIAFKTTVDGIKVLLEAAGGKIAIHDDKVYVMQLRRDKTFIGIPTPLDAEILEDFKDTMLLTDIDSLYPDPNAPEKSPPVPAEAPGADPLNLLLQPEGGQPPASQPAPSPPVPPVPPLDAWRNTNPAWDLLIPSGPTFDTRVRRSIQDKLRLTPDQLEQLRARLRKTDSMVDGVIEEWYEKVRNAINFQRDDWMGTFLSLSKKHGYHTDADNIGLLLAEALEIELIAGPMDQTVQDMLLDAVKEGFLDMGDRLGTEVNWDQGDPWSVAWVKGNWPIVSEGLKNGLSQEIKFAIRDGLLAGDGYPSITRRIKGSIANYKDSTHKVVHKVVHHTVMCAEAEMLGWEGEGGPDKPLIYITMGDSRVRPEHQIREGMFLTRWEVPMLFGDWGCRCYFETSTAVERVLGRSLGPEEFGLPPNDFEREHVGLMGRV